MRVIRGRGYGGRRPRRRKPEPRQTTHVLLQRGRGNIPRIRAIGKDFGEVVDKTQKVLKKSSKKAQFRFATLTVRETLPVFRKGE